MFQIKRKSMIFILFCFYHVNYEETHIWLNFKRTVHRLNITMYANSKFTKLRKSILNFQYSNWVLMFIIFIFFITISHLDLHLYTDHSYGDTACIKIWTGFYHVVCTSIIHVQSYSLDWANFICPTVYYLSMNGNK